MVLASDMDEPSQSLTRRGLLARAGLAGAATVAGGALEVPQALANPRPPRPTTPDEALRALMAGNGRYVHNQIRSVDYNRLGDRIAETQTPIAAIITCADSRLSPPAVFDVGEGNLFVSRVAGNSILPATLGSTEYAVAKLGVLLIMVLGHSDCGAVKAAIEVANGQAHFPRSKYGRIGDVVAPLLAPVRALPRRQRTLPRCIAANARAQARRLASAGPIVKPAVDSGRVGVVAAVYDIRSGRVTLA